MLGFDMQLRNLQGLFDVAFYYIVQAKGRFPVGGVRNNRYAWLIYNAAEVGYLSWDPNEVAENRGIGVVSTLSPLVLTYRELPGVIGNQLYIAWPAFASANYVTFVEVFAIPNMPFPGGLGV